MIGPEREDRFNNKAYERGRSPLSLGPKKIAIRRYRFLGCPGCFKNLYAFEELSTVRSRGTRGVLEKVWLGLYLNLNFLELGLIPVAENQPVKIITDLS
jgi:hypothetical protein